MRNYKKMLLSAAVVLTLLAGCGGSDAPSSSLPEENTSMPVSSEENVKPEKVDRTFNETYKNEDGDALLKVSVVYPDLGGKLDAKALKKVDAYYAADSKEQEAFWQEIADAAEDTVKSGEESDAYTWNENYKIAAEGENYISVVRTSQAWTGGAHDTEIVRSEVFRKSDGEKLTLDMLFRDGKVPQEELSDAFLQVVQRVSGERGYFDDAAETVAQGYHPEKFYLTDTGIVFIFDVYEIAPFAAGTQYVEVPVAELPGFAAP